MSYWPSKICVVTGGSRGLGRAIAGALADAGASVVVSARGQTDLGRAVKEMADRGADVHAVCADVRHNSDVQRLMATTVDRFGRIDLLAHCTGRSARGRIEDVDVDVFREMFEDNFLAAVRATRAALPHLLKSRGHLIHVGSLASKVAARYLAAYPAGKHALAAYAQQLRLELGPAGLHVLLVCPGPIARSDGDRRYTEAARHLPPAATRPGAGARVRAIDPVWLAGRVRRATERRQPELIVPGRARVLFALSALFPRWGDRLVLRHTSSAADAVG